MIQLLKKIISWEVLVIAVVVWGGTDLILMTQAQTLRQYCVEAPADSADGQEVFPGEAVTLYFKIIPPTPNSVRDTDGNVLSDTEILNNIKTDLQVVWGIETNRHIVAPFTSANFDGTNINLEAKISGGSLDNYQREYGYIMETVARNPNAGIFSDGDDGYVIELVGGGNCEGSIFLSPKDDIVLGSCSGQPENRFQCIEGSEGVWSEDAGGYNTCFSNTSTICEDSAINAVNSAGANIVCVRCANNDEIVPPEDKEIVGHLDTCDPSGRTTICESEDSDMSCRDYDGTGPKCLFPRNHIIEENSSLPCMTGGDECDTVSGLNCAKNETGKPIIAEFGNPGICRKLEVDRCDGINSVCEGMKPADAANAWCDQNTCIYSDMSKEDYDKYVSGRIDTPLPITVPNGTGSSTSGGFSENANQSNEGLEVCNGSLACANCIVRDKSGNVFPTFRDAALAEEAGEILYTNSVYTALGCVDPSQEGITVRLLQIGLGTSGFIILIRFFQAAFLLFKGDPESYSEAANIAWTALLALIMIVFAVTGLSFIGINLFRVLSPGTITT